MDKGKQNLYKLFVEQSYNLCKEHGLATLIVQSSLMCDLSSAATRQLLLVLCQASVEGYSFLSLILASSVVNRQWTVARC